MGHKSNPIGLRLQINRTWDSRWYAEGRDYAKLLSEDIEIRKHIIDTLPQADRITLLTHLMRPLLRTREPRSAAC